MIEHTPEALDVWLTELHQKVKGRIAIAVELKKGPVVYALQKYPFITVFPVHALSLARYRQAFSPSGAKDDPQDAELALELMLRYPQKIKAIEPDNADIRLLQQLVVHGIACQFGNAGHMHLFQQTRLVRAHRFVADAQGIGNVIDPHALDQAFENIKLAR